MNPLQILYGIATFIPGVNELLAVGSGGTGSARYCYSVWLRHLVMAHKNNLNTNPKVIAELGPGDSLGIGLAALISGSEKYFAFDVVEHANLKNNLDVFDELVSLFKNRTAIPDQGEFKNVKPVLENYDFPSDILTSERLEFALDESRLQEIRQNLINLNGNKSMIQYKAPWFDDGKVEYDSVDMIFSQAVLEHIDDLEGTYSSMEKWLKHKGFMSHQIDFKCHGTSNQWNGHWAHSDFMWKLIRGNRPYSLNRQPHSVHIDLINKRKFRLVCDDKVTLESKLNINQLAPRFRTLTKSDLTTSGSFVQAVKE